MALGEAFFAQQLFAKRHHDERLAWHSPSSLRRGRRTTSDFGRYLLADVAERVTEFEVEQPTGDEYGERLAERSN